MRHDDVCDVKLSDVHADVFGIPCIFGRNTSKIDLSAMEIVVFD